MNILPIRPKPKLLDIDQGNLRTKLN